MVRIICLLLGLIFSTGGWHYNMQEAKEVARKEHKHILLNFSGSDWCGPCILLRKNIFDDPVFLKMADTALVLVEADFPRMKKNRLSEEQQRLNDQAADRYNKNGRFPLTLLLDADGKILKEWEGYPAIKPGEFSLEVRAAIDANK